MFELLYYGLLQAHFYSQIFWKLLQLENQSFAKAIGAKPSIKYL